MMMNDGGGGDGCVGRDGNEGIQSSKTQIKIQLMEDSMISKKKLFSFRTSLLHDLHGNARRGHGHHLRVLELRHALQIAEHHLTELVPTNRAVTMGLDVGEEK